jgi:hypothetical protein
MIKDARHVLEHDGVLCRTSWWVAWLGGCLGDVAMLVDPASGVLKSPSRCFFLEVTCTCCIVLP